MNAISMYCYTSVVKVDLVCDIQKKLHVSFITRIGYTILSWENALTKWRCFLVSMKI